MHGIVEFLKDIKYIALVISSLIPASLFNWHSMTYKNTFPYVVLFSIVTLFIISAVLIYNQRAMQREMRADILRNTVGAIYNRFEKEEYITCNEVIQELDSLEKIRIELKVNSFTERRMKKLLSKIKV